jgi:hypothetical protein
MERQSAIGQTTVHTVHEHVINILTTVFKISCNYCIINKKIKIETKPIYT